MADLLLLETALRSCDKHSNVLSVGWSDPWEQNMLPIPLLPYQPDSSALLLLHMVSLPLPLLLLLLGGEAGLEIGLTFEPGTQPRQEAPQSWWGTVGNEIPLMHWGGGLLWSPLCALPSTDAARS